MAPALGGSKLQEYLRECKEPLRDGLRKPTMVFGDPPPRGHVPPYVGVSSELFTKFGPNVAANENYKQVINKERDSGDIHRALQMRGEFKIKSKDEVCSREGVAYARMSDLMPGYSSLSLAYTDLGWERHQATGNAVPPAMPDHVPCELGGRSRSSSCPSGSVVSRCSRASTVNRRSRRSNAQRGASRCSNQLHLANGCEKTQQLKYGSPPVDDAMAVDIHKCTPKAQAAGEAAMLNVSDNSAPLDSSLPATRVELAAHQPGTTQAASRRPDSAPFALGVQSRKSCTMPSGDRSRAARGCRPASALAARGCQPASAPTGEQHALVKVALAKDCRPASAPTGERAARSSVARSASGGELTKLKSCSRAASVPVDSNFARSAQKHAEADRQMNALLQSRFRQKMHFL